MISNWSTISIQLHPVRTHFNRNWTSLILPHTSMTLTFSASSQMCLNAIISGAELQYEQMQVCRTLQAALTLYTKTCRIKSYC